MIDEALQYAGRGWRVFPVHSVERNALGAVLGCTCRKPTCQQPAKHPRIREWQRTATTDAATINGWWKRWPDANVGIATGGGLVVLDVDSASQAEAVKAAMGELPRTAAVATGRGFHLYFAGEIGPSRFAESQGERLLLRGAGGYVIAPPSWHASGKQYQWVIDESLSELPARVVEFFQASGNTGNNTSNAGLRLDEAPAWITQRYQPFNGHGYRDVTGAASLASRAMILIREPWSIEEQTRIESALGVLPASCGRDAWLHIGMALHGLHWERADGTDIGFEIWDRWSATAPEKYSLHDVETRWRSFGAREGVTLGTLYHMAREAGWAGGVAVMPATGTSSGGGGLHISQTAVTTVLYPDAQTAHEPPRSTFNGPTAVVFPDTTRDGDPKATVLNTRRAIEGLGILCEKDMFHNRMLVGGRLVEDWAGEISDDSLQMVRAKIREVYRFDPGLLNVHDACTQLSLTNQFDPVLDYLDGLTWDGKPRLDTWLQVYLGAEGSALNAAIGRLALVAAVRRARAPGTKFDQIIVLESPEGHGKSTAIEILAGSDSFSDQTILTLDDKGQQEAIEGVWLYEIADLAGMTRAEVERIKAFASRKVDRARKAYARTRVSQPRRTVFFATTNNQTYLKSQTGNRRFWPVTVGRVDLRALVRDRDMLWAEAAICEAQGVPLELNESLWGAAAEVQDARREQDPWELLLAHLPGEKAEPYWTGYEMEYRIPSLELLQNYLRLDPGQMSDVTAKRLALVMRRLSWDGPKALRVAGVVQKGYTKKAVTSD